MEGVSLKPILRQSEEAGQLEKQLDDRTLFAHRIVKDPKIHIWAVIHKHWKMIEFQDGKKVLFDHRNDLAEKHDVLPANKKIAAELTAKLEHFKVYGKREKSETVPVEMDKDLTETLKTLGYVGD